MNLKCGLVALPLVLGACFSAQEASVDRESDEAAIRSLLSANFAASTAGDSAGVQDPFMPDGDGWIAGLPRVTGRDERLDAEEEFGGLPGFQSFDGRVESIRFISRDAAIVEIAATTVLDTGRFEEETTVVVARTQDDWKIAAWRVMTFDPVLLRCSENSDAEVNNKSNTRRSLASVPPGPRSRFVRR